MASRPFALVATVLLIGSVVPFALAAGYSISASDTTPIPERTVEFQDTSYTLNSTVRAASGATVSVTVSAPDEVYRVYIYNSDEQIEAQKRGDGDGTYTFDLTGYEPGSYVITTYSRNSDDYTAVQPLLIEGYDVSADAPSSVRQDESATVTIGVTQTAASARPAHVKAIVAADGTTHTVEASQSNGGYTATIDAGTLAPGTYTVYGVAQDDEQAFGRSELVGLSNGQSLTVRSAATATETHSDMDTDDGGVTSTATQTDGGTQTTTETATEPDTENQPRTTTTTAPAQDTATASDTATATEAGVITPGDSTPTATTSESGPGFSIAIATVAVLVVAAFVGRRR